MKKLLMRLHKQPSWMPSIDASRIVLILQWIKFAPLALYGIAVAVSGAIYGLRGYQENFWPWGVGNFFLGIA